MSSSDTAGVAALPEWAVESGVSSSFVELSNAVAVAEVSVPAMPTPGGVYDGQQNLSSNTMRVGLLVNPTDTRCYRMIARVLNDDPGLIPFNTMHTPADVLAVSTATAAFGAALRRTTGLFLQTLHLGNNSMVADPMTGNVCLGNAHEPYFYHVHLLCRGDPDRAYAVDADEHDYCPILAGPPVGVNVEVQTGDKRPGTDGDVAAIARTMRRVCASVEAADCMLPLLFSPTGIITTTAAGDGS